MKKITLLTIIMLSNIAPTFGVDIDTKGPKHGDVTGHTFMTLRPPFWSASPEKVSFWHAGDRARARECGINDPFQIVPFGGQTADEHGVARYFTFANKIDLIVTNQREELIIDINPRHFGIVTLDGFYESTISFRPRQKYAGIGIEYWQYFGCNEHSEKHWFFDISLPIEWVKNDIGLEESISLNPIEYAPGSALNMIEAFKGIIDLLGTNSRITFGKINGSQSKAGIADIETKLGYEFLCTENSYADGYLGVLIPTGNRPKAEFIFEPIIGRNFHAAVMFGGNFEYKIWQKKSEELWLTLDLNSRYFFRGTETRSFDLFNRPWSRYMLMYANEADASAGILTPGINILTRKVAVTPRFMTNFTAAMVYFAYSFTGEIGWNFYAHQAEKVRLKESWVEGPVVAALNNESELIFDNDGRGGVNELSSIGKNNNSRNPEAFNNMDCLAGAAVQVYNDRSIIRTEDLNLNSAATPAQLSNTIYGAIGYCFGCEYPMFVGGGGSYEFAGVNTVPSRWMVWGKFGLSL